MAKFSGEVTSEIVEARFAFSGKVVFVGKKVGESIYAGQIVASLDRKILQTELDRQLADYNRIRAQFEKSTKDIINQSALDISVKDVESAKYKLDQADLISPIAGTVLDLGGLVVGLNVTPAGSPVKIVSHEKFFVFKIGQKDLLKFSESQKVKISFEGFKEKVEGLTSPPFFGKTGNFDISVKLAESTSLVPGLTGIANF